MGTIGIEIGREAKTEGKKREGMGGGVFPRLLPSETNLGTLPPTMQYPRRSLLVNKIVKFLLGYIPLLVFL